VTLELNQLTDVIEEMGQAFARQQRQFGQLVERARAWLGEFADKGRAFEDVAWEFNAAVPTHEPLDQVVPLPTLPERFTVMGADGTQIQPDRHGLALYYMINLGSLVYRHGSGETPEARSVPRLCYKEEDLYEGALLVVGNLLDVRRDRAELEHLADLVEAEPAGPTVALVDGTILLWVLENLPAPGRGEKIEGYLEQVERIRHKGAAPAAFTSRPRYTGVGRLLHLAHLGGDVERAHSEPNPLERLPDRAIFSSLAAGARSPLFASPGTVNRDYYAPTGNQVYFFYVNVAGEEEEAVVARVETPAWVVDEPELLALVHGAVVLQSRIAGGFPYVLARADELAFISGPERQRLEEMVAVALLRAGVVPGLSPKADYKGLTRGGRGW
jgi:hypothetical protein